MEHSSDLDHDYISSSKSSRQAFNPELGDIYHFLKPYTQCDTLSEGLNDSLKSKIQTALNQDSLEKLASAINHCPKMKTLIVKDMIRLNNAMIGQMGGKKWAL